MSWIDNVFLNIPDYASTEVKNWKNNRDLMFLEDGLSSRSESQAGCLWLCWWGKYDIPVGRWYHSNHAIGIGRSSPTKCWERGNWKLCNQPLQSDAVY